MLSVPRDKPVSKRILVYARHMVCVSVSISLYRAGMRLALFPPLGIAMASLTKLALGFTDVSPVIHSTLSGRGDLFC